MRSSPTSTVVLPDDCPRSPAIDGLPDRPTALDEDSVTAFVLEYEQVLARARSPDLFGFGRFEHVSTQAADGGYRVYIYVVPSKPTQPAPSTNEHAPTETSTSRTPTPTPETTREYNVGYYVDAHRIIRDKRPSAITYRYAPWDGFNPRNGGNLIQCSTREG